ncbi:MAG: hypothetical protein J2P17_24280 [Mycobacterium sp.]|nr:hypothetical protein [Mycobacterium sp.]
MSQSRATSSLVAYADEVLCRPRPPAREDPAVVLVEQILAAAAAAAGSVDILRKGRLAVTQALWICACLTIDDSPRWLIYETPNGDLGWNRIPDGADPLDLVETRLIPGGHADPAEVLRWLQGIASDPWSGGGYGDGDAGVLDELRTKVRQPY